MSRKLVQVQVQVQNRMMRMEIDVGEYGRKCYEAKGL